MRTGRTALLAAARAFVLAGAACGSGGGGGADDEAPVEIGLLTDLSGPFKSFGSDIRLAVDLAVEEINASGGVNGSPIAVVVFDSPGDPEQAVVGVRRLAEQDGVVAIVGPVSSGEAEVSFPQAASLQVPMVTGTANKEGITALGEGWAFRNTATNTQLYQAAMPVFEGAYGVSDAVLVYDEQEPFAVAAAEFAVPAVAEQTGLTIAERLTIRRGQTDFTSVVERIRGMDVDGVLVMAGPIEAGLLCREMHRQDAHLPVLGHPAQNSSAFREAAGPEVEDWVVPSVFSTTAGAEAEAFSAAMADRDPEPPTVPEAANYYDIVRMIAQVATDAGIDGSTPPEEARRLIREGLASLAGFPGLAGPTAFLENGDVDRPVFTLVLEGEGASLLAGS
ncbi:MAG: ABC transporter substrate-binding protein [Actinobacteria bacterium]|nr:ABC transporter substrate-binding protein [Actinomycetota bacterium]